MSETLGQLAILAVAVPLCYLLWKWEQRKRADPAVLSAFTAVHAVLGVPLETVNSMRRVIPTDPREWVKVTRVAGQFAELTIMHPADLLVGRFDSLDRQVMHYNPTFQLAERLQNCSIYRPVPELPELALFSPFGCGPTELPFAVGAADSLISWDVNADPHALVTGPTGSGKTSAIRVLVASALAAGFDVYAVDPKRVELSYLRGRIAEVASELKEMVDLVGRIRQTMMDRYAEIEIAHASDLPTPTFSPILLVVDEFAELIALAEKDTVGKDLDSLGRLGRSAGIHLLLATQRPDASKLPGELKSNVTARLAVGRIDGIASTMVFGDAEVAALIPHGKGGALFRHGAELTPCRTMWLANPLDANSPEDRAAAERWLPRKAQHALVEVDNGVIEVDPSLVNAVDAIREVAPKLRPRRTPAGQAE